MDFDRIASSAPLNRDASVVRDGSGDLWEAKIPETVNRWIAPPPIKSLASLGEIGQAMARELIGRRCGRLTVLGIWAETNPKKNSVWVVRCDCGYYEGRKAKALRGAFAHQLACTACDALESLRKRAAQPNTAANRAASAKMLDKLAKGSAR